MTNSEYTAAAHAKIAAAMAKGAEYVWVRADSDRGRRRLPATAKCYSLRIGVKRGADYLYRVPAADALNISFAATGYGGVCKLVSRVNEENYRKCWA